MKQYLLQLSYTPEAFASLVENPHDRREAVRPVLANLGGTLDQAFFAFGDHDVVLLVSLPENVSAAALSFALSAGGAVRNVKTTPLLGIAEAMEAMHKAQSAGYTPVTKVAKAAG